MSVIYISLILKWDFLNLEVVQCCSHVHCSFWIAAINSECEMWLFSPWTYKGFCVIDRNGTKASQLKISGEDYWNPFSSLPLWLSEEYKEVISFTLSRSTILRLYNMPFSLSYHFLLACFTDWALVLQKSIHDHYGKSRVYSLNNCRLTRP